MWLLLACTPDPVDSSVETGNPPDTDTDAPDTDTDTDTPVDGWSPPACADAPCASLADWGLFTYAWTPADGVVPYDVNSPLWSDAAVKQRFLALPAGATATWQATGTLEFPTGTVLVKTFAFPRADGTGLEPVETRLLVSGPSGWKGRVYRWQGDDAAWFADGATVDLTWLDGETVRTDPYVVPDERMCDACHSVDFATSPLGTSAVQLVRGDQLERLFQAGVFTVRPASGDVTPLADPADATATIEARARSWLHANCAHCHSADGTARITNLYLTVDESDPTRLGTCKPPGQGDGGTGLAFDVVPGHPEQSFLVARISATDPVLKMPVAPNLRPDALGVDLVTGWIAAMQESPCN